MSLRWNGRMLRVVLAVVAALAVMMASVVPAAAEGKKKNRRYTVNRGPCKIEKLPKGASHQWTPAGESVVHRVRYGQGLQGIAHSYGFKGDTAFRRLFDANPQLERPWLDRPGMTIRIPTCDSELRRRKLPKPPPPPEPEPEETAPSPDESTSDGGGSAPEEAPAPQPEQATAVPSGSVWDSLAECESGGDWSINTGNGYYGGLQFSAGSWAAVGGSGLPHQHSRAEQIKRAELLKAQQGWGAWPACSAKLGLR